MLTDFHVHTGASYCADKGLGPENYASKLRESKDFSSVVVADHSMAIYFPDQVAWSWRYIVDSSVFDAHRDFGNARLLAHMERLSLFGDKGLIPGLETEMMHDGRFTFDPGLRGAFKTLIGSVHWLPDNKDSGASHGLVYERWLEHSLKLIDSGIDILGHPFRWIAYNVPEFPKESIAELVSRAKAAGVALELNSHYKIGSDAEMLREVARQGALLALSTDSHHPHEILDFSYHFKALEDAGLKLSDFNLLLP